MRDTPYYIVAQNMLQLLADLASAMSSFTCLLVNPVAEFDRSGAVGLPCQSESAAKQPWHLLQGCQPLSVHGWGWDAGTARYHVMHICDFEEEDGMGYEIIWTEIIKYSTQIIIPWREHGRSCWFSELGCIEIVVLVEWTLLFSWFVVQMPDSIWKILEYHHTYMLMLLLLQLPFTCVQHYLT